MKAHGHESAQNGPEGFQARSGGFCSRRRLIRAHLEWYLVSRAGRILELCYWFATGIDGRSEI
jgi:hypothetical protein